MRSRRLASELLVVLAMVTGCAHPTVKERPPLSDIVPLTEGDLWAQMKTELLDEILTSYDRDEPPETETGMIDPKIGTARIGVGPGDVLVAEELARAPSRLPLFVGRDTTTSVRSKWIEINKAQDLSAAWMSDEVSWRIEMCGRIAVIPLRITALYARDGDRWVQVFEHVAYGRAAAPHHDGQLFGKPIKDAFASSEFKDTLSSVLATGVFRPETNRDPATIATGPESALFGPDINDEWHAADILTAKLGLGALSAEDRRVGTVGRSIAKSTIAYWVGNVIANLPARPGVAAGKARLRATFVFEKRNGVWVVVQGQISQPIEDQDLAADVFGTALISLNPLAITCDDGSRPAPGAL